jgi:cbb3-type cytochrome oxidase subunit 1
MTIKNIFKIISFGILIYLLTTSFSYIHFISGKEDFGYAIMKYEIDSSKNIALVKAKAINYIGEMQGMDRKESHISVINFWLLLALIIIQLFLLIKRLDTSGWTKKITGYPKDEINGPNTEFVKDWVE